MLIEQSSISVIEPKVCRTLSAAAEAGRRQNYLWPLILGTIITLTAATLPILLVVVKSDQPTGTLLSPIPKGVITENRSAPIPLSSQQALILARNYLSKAYDLLRNPNQTEHDKAAIRISLEKGLRQVPEIAEGQGLRREILAEIRKLSPTEQNLVVAAPGQDSTSSSQTNLESSANQKSFILPAGLTELTIKDTQVKTGSYIYLLPVENSSNIISLKSKTVGSFTISADSLQSIDIPVDYYIINE
ncbi:hypothetical protein A3A84_03665 [Candidatus Collierbacteria bacterium RIFCSPLOWO2_01_FULL_50_23]|uniref:Uncharacterized protein n=1 Tax=Candidatus Collierbacteria bacterium RIFCSPHIGHO2_01_FULL_50_25 TaxID=1817722 RepID=A0A1F5EVW0_9BACT|nr:MAG: hypothetical protein A2703_00745 [Candidatus Collierbacteria bacterium RIFCSPHIGHO2_01_FULL_50_25]OGD74769.1 MAG: hypothetical protein A3A84_03665 [Candidatus Collierbacteria bacterium RIFCSPLOWO2_01_FULL_50_23]